MGRLTMRFIPVLIAIVIAMWLLSVQVDRQNYREAQQQELLK